MQGTLIEWLTYIGDIHTSSIDLGLKRILPIAVKLNLVHFNFPVITVAGTNGKGSVIKTLESIYRAAGYQVAAYTSPHLLDFNERLIINGEAVEDHKLIAAFEVVEKARGDTSLSFFEFTTLAILSICRELPLDVLLLEVGLGGRLDAVNIVDSDVAVVTNVDLDHMEWLGDTREKIGFEKAGIYRCGKIGICGDPDPPQSLLQFAAKNNVTLYCIDRDYSYETSDENWSWQGPAKSYKNLPLPHLKLQNIATALMAIETLNLPVPLEAIKKGVLQAQLSGRYEVLQHKCKIIFDVAHNPQGAVYLAERFAKEAPAGKRRAVVGMLKDKNIADTLAALVPFVDTWYVATLHDARGAKAEALSSYLSEKSVTSCYNFTTVALAMQSALEQCRAEDVLLVFGSFHTVADAKRFMLKETTDANVN